MKFLWLTALYCRAPLVTCESAMITSLGSWKRHRPLIGTCRSGRYSGAISLNTDHLHANSNLLPDSFLGAHYSYAQVDTFKVISRFLGWQRKQPTISFGHFAQGFVPAIIAREILIRNFRRQ